MSKRDEEVREVIIDLLKKCVDCIGEKECYKDSPISDTLSRLNAIYARKVKKICCNYWRARGWLERQIGLTYKSIAIHYCPECGKSLKRKK